MCASLSVKLPSLNFFFSVLNSIRCAYCCCLKFLAPAASIIISYCEASGECGHGAAHFISWRCFRDEARSQQKSNEHIKSSGKFCNCQQRKLKSSLRFVFASRNHLLDISMGVFQHLLSIFRSLQKSNGNPKMWKDAYRDADQDVQRCGEAKGGLNFRGAQRGDEMFNVPPR